MRTLPLNRLLFASLTFALLGPTLSGCGKNDGPPREVLPPVTETGLNKAGALVNGGIWAPLQGVLFGSPAIRVNVNRTPQSGRGFEFRLSLSRQAPAGNEKYYPFPDSNLSFFLTSLLVPGTFELNQSVSPPFPSQTWASYGVFSDRTMNPTASFPTGPGQAAGQLVITRFDTVARVVAGTFEFTGQRGADLVKITQGRFDVTY